MTENVVDPFTPKQVETVFIPNAYQIVFDNPFVGHQIMSVKMESVGVTPGMKNIHNVNPNPYTLFYPDDPTVASSTQFPLIDENKQPTEEMMSLQEFKRALASIAIWYVKADAQRQAEMMAQMALMNQGGGGV